MPTGRRDGLVSLASDAESIPGPKDSIDDQIKKFANKGLSIEDLVTLVGKLRLKARTVAITTN